MRRKPIVFALLNILIVTFALLTAGSSLAASQEEVLFAFPYAGGYPDGTYPAGPLVFDAAGNLYGTAVYGGANGDGTVFKLTPGANGTWTPTVFSFNGHNGAHPGGGLIFDAAGNLYGTTGEGGDWGYGTVFEITPEANGEWEESVLYSFSGETDGGNPNSTLVFDAAGNLYGTTFDGGFTEGVVGGGYGTVFELFPGPKGKWIEKVLKAFHGPDGANPRAGVVFDSSGNLYGGTMVGGHDQDCSGGSGCGVVFKLTPGANGTWTETVLHNFYRTTSDGYYDPGGVILDSAGNLYGITLLGGDNGGGVIFRLSPNEKGQWFYKILYSLGDVGGSALSYGGLLLDAAGNLYGTTGTSDIPPDYYYGNVFQLAPTSQGEWNFTVLQYFDLLDGANPAASLIFDAAGNLYGTSSFGGIICDTCGDGQGVVFEVER
jgi:uncharacterized repeat protein (TIGR03803 family)